MNDSIIKTIEKRLEALKEEIKTADWKKHEASTKEIACRRECEELNKEFATLTNCLRELKGEKRL